MTHHTHTIESTRQALEHIPANLPRDEWARVGMAIKSEFPDEAGFDLFAQWSENAPGFKASDCRTAWKSFKAGGAVSMGTLLHLAKQHGYTLPKDGQAAAKPSPEVLAQRQREQAEAQAREAEAQSLRHEAAAVAALTAWQAGSDQGESAYLVRKGVKGYGLRYTAADGALMVPLRDATGKLWNVQNIRPDGVKRFLKDGRKSGLWHMLGAVPAPAAVARAGARDGDQAAAVRVILVAEGYATAASLHEATGYPCAVAFDAGNLDKVASALRQHYPAALVAVCGDDDQKTYKEKGSNPGKIKATAAAVAVQGLAVFPLDLAADQSDFNDMHQAHGLDAVRDCVLSAIADHELAALAAQDDAPDDAQAAPDGATHPANAPGKAKPSARKKKPSSGAGAGAAGGDGGHGGDDDHGGEGKTSRAPFDRFHVDESGVWYNPPGDEGASPKRICDPLYAVALARDDQDLQAGLMLEFDTEFGQRRRWLMPLAMLSGDGAAYRAALQSQAFKTPMAPALRQLLNQYLNDRKPNEHIRHTPRVGWHGRCYVLPDEIIGDNGEGDKYIFYTEGAQESRFNQRGKLDAWICNVAALANQNTRLTFAMSVSFAAPLLAWLAGQPGGGFHFVGATSTGKTTGFLMAASIWGVGAEQHPKSYLQKWKATGNGLEFLAEHHSDAPLILDELGQLDENEIGKAIYMLADGQGKNRGKGAGGLRAKPTWRSLFLSTGEVTAAQAMAMTGKKEKGGQEIRMIPIPTEVSEGSAVEHYHHCETGHEFSNHIKEQCVKHYGRAGRAWLEHLTQNTEGMSARLKTDVEAMEARLMPAGAVGPVKRAVRRFALAAVGGEWATRAGLTGWPEGWPEQAAKACIQAWIGQRGGAGSSEVTTILRQVRAFIETSGEGQFVDWHRAYDDKRAKAIIRSGFRLWVSADGRPVKSTKDHQSVYGDELVAKIDYTDTSFEYYVLPEAFRANACQGLDHDTVCKVLVDHGCMERSKDRYTYKARLPGAGAPVSCYKITSKLLTLDL
jgi:putative DNA primase/helicase